MKNFLIKILMILLILMVLYVIWFFVFRDFWLENMNTNLNNFILKISNFVEYISSENPDFNQLF